ncbi:MAG: SPOR domain-containing protein [Bacteroidetes bacterium]|nr:SPOR domain-containing protein [Bacteroidota bacterium]
MLPTLHRCSRFYLPLILLAALGLALPGGLAQAQARRDIAVLVTQVKSGAAAEVEKLLPSLKKSHPDKAGVLFLEALLETNAEKAVELYQRVADEYARSEWADDALYRLYQYSYAVGAYRTARSYTDRMMKEFPQSPFLSREQRAAAKTDAGKTAASSSPSGGPMAAKDPTTAKSTPATIKENDSAKSYAVQVGAYAREADARKQVEELKTKGYTAYVREKTVNKKTVQAVWLGIFPGFDQAQAFARKLKEQQKIDAIVVRR